MPSLSNGTESPLFDYVALRSPHADTQTRIDLAKSGRLHYYFALPLMVINNQHSMEFVRILLHSKILFILLLFPAII